MVQSSEMEELETTTEKYKERVSHTSDSSYNATIVFSKANGQGGKIQKVIFVKK